MISAALLIIAVVKIRPITLKNNHTQGRKVTTKHKTPMFEILSKQSSGEKKIGFYCSNATL